MWSTANNSTVRGGGECQLHLHKALKRESLRLKLEETIPVAHTKRLKKKQSGSHAVGDSLLRHPSAGLIYSQQKFTAWPGAEIWGVTARLPQQVKSTDYYHLILFHVDTNDTVKHNPGKFSEDFRALVAQMKRRGSSGLIILLVRDRGAGRS